MTTISKNDLAHFYGLCLSDHVYVSSEDPIVVTFFFDEGSRFYFDQQATLEFLTTTISLNKHFGDKTFTQKELEEYIYDKGLEEL